MSEKLYTHVIFGGLAPYADWHYLDNTTGELLNAVDDGSAVEVVQNSRGEWVPAIGAGGDDE